MKSTYRIIDVNFNRLFEGLKIVEDVIRFYFEDRKLLSEVRRIESQARDLYQKTPYDKLILHRYSEGDLGRRAGFDYGKRASVEELLRANLNRIKGACRGLEEVSKLHTLTFGKFKRIRFLIYDLEKEILLKLAKKFVPTFYVILDEKYIYSVDPAYLLRALRRHDVGMVQLRFKKASTDEFYRWAKKIRKLIPEGNMKFLINDRLDIALASGADGIHIGKEDLPLAKIRKVAPHMIIGQTVRSVTDAREAEKQGADYVAVGSIFPTTTKADARVVGLRLLRKISNAVEMPVVAIGGIKLANVEKVLRQGASGIAVCSAIFEGSITKNLGRLGREIKKIKKS